MQHVADKLSGPIAVMPDRQLSQLQQLTVRGCSTLTQLDLAQGLPALQELTAEECTGLTSIVSTAYRWSSLESLVIQGFMGTSLLQSVRQAENRHMILSAHSPSAKHQESTEPNRAFVRT